VARISSAQAPICNCIIFLAQRDSPFCTAACSRLAIALAGDSKRGQSFQITTIVGHSPENEATAKGLSAMLALLHEKTARWVNRLDSTSGRKVWHNYRETRLSYEKSYLARLNYVHQNAVKHGLVPVANQYPWCSARWFERNATPAQIKTIYRIKTNQINVADDFEVANQW
jgi:hypothetical protein